MIISWFWVHRKLWRKRANAEGMLITTRDFWRGVTVFHVKPFGLHQWATTDGGYLHGIERKRWAARYWSGRLDRDWKG